MKKKKLFICNNIELFLKSNDFYAKIIGNKI